MKLDSVIFFVKDIDQACGWYAEILDCRPQYENENYAFLSINGFHIGFHPEDNKSSSGNYGQTSYWRVDCLSETVNLYTSRGAVLYRGPIKTSLNEYACILRDPFNNTIGLISSKA